jgi:dolichol-phosphate mannosyltransferase
VEKDRSKMEKENRRIKLSVVMPVLNEGANLKVILPILKAMINVPHEVLVVYDIQNDNSIAVVKSMQKSYPGLKLVYNKLGRGVINAMKSGVRAAGGNYVLTIAADDIGPPLAINDMIVLMDKGCDLVNGTRYKHGGKNAGGVFISRLLSTTANYIFHVLSGSSLTDPTFGVKMFKHSRFNELNLKSKPVGWSVSFEFAIKAQVAGWKLGEVPLISLNRLYGKGKSSFRLNWVSEYMKWFLFGTRKLLFRRKNKVIVRIPENLKP